MYSKRKERTKHKKINRDKIYWIRAIKDLSRITLEYKASAEVIKNHFNARY